MKNKLNHKKSHSKYKLIEKLLNNDRIALARVISLIEDRDENLRQIVDEIYPHTGNAFVIGITGPPGAGKSTITDKLIATIRSHENEKVAVIAVDPSSPFTGGAILGDRIRMQAHFNDPNVYIRSLGTRGRHGGISQSSKEVIMALDAAGFKWVIVETAGVGQTELEILKVAHAICVVLVPESGDGIQMMKAGLMEIADLFVVNKCDRPEAEKLIRELEIVLGIMQHPEKNSWEIPIIRSQALKDIGISELFEKIIEYKKFAEQKSLLQEKRERFIREEILEIVSNRFNQLMRYKMAENKGKSILNAVYNMLETPHSAAEMFYSDNT